MVKYELLLYRARSSGERVGSSGQHGLVFAPQKETCANNFIAQAPELTIFFVDSILQPGAQLLLAVVAGLAGKLMLAECFGPHGLNATSATLGGGCAWCRQWLSRESLDI